MNVNPDVVCVDRVYHSLLQKMEEIPLNSPLSTAACNTSSYNMPLDHNLQSLLGKISGSQYLKKQPLHNVAWY